MSTPRADGGGFEPQLAKRARDRVLESGEPQPTAGPRQAAAVEHAQVSDQWLEPGVVSGRRDHDVGRDRAATGKPHTVGLERLDRRYHPEHALLGTVRESGVEHRQPALAAMV